MQPLFTHANNPSSSKSKQLYITIWTIRLKCMHLSKRLSARTIITWLIIISALEGGQALISNCKLLFNRKTTTNWQVSKCQSIYESKTTAIRNFLRLSLPVWMRNRDRKGDLKIYRINKTQHLWSLRLILSVSITNRRIAMRQQNKSQISKEVELSNPQVNTSTAQFT